MVDGLLYIIMSQKVSKFAEGVEVENNELFEVPKPVDVNCLDIGS
jgi:hypothetical protein